MAKLVSAATLAWTAAEWMQRDKPTVLGAVSGTVAGLVAIAPEYPPVRLGVVAGEIEMGPDFDDPLPEFAPYSS